MPPSYHRWRENAIEQLTCSIFGTQLFASATPFKHAEAVETFPLSYKVLFFDQPNLSFFFSSTKLNLDLYQHVRVVVSILLGFSLTHLLKGVARIVQHPGRERVYWVDLVWTWFMFFYLITFWWWEFRFP
jgi:hypothetical protein